MRLLGHVGSVCLFAAWWALTLHAGFAQQPAPAAEPSTRQTRTAEKYYAQGVRAMEKGDLDAAEKAFAQAAKADPSNRDYAVDQQIATQHRITKLIQDADKARILGQPEV